eukprot:1523797-Prymnesium_polylepis.1
MCLPLAAPPCHCLRDGARMIGSNESIPPSPPCHAAAARAPRSDDERSACEEATTADRHPCARHRVTPMRPP